MNMSEASAVKRPLGHEATRPFVVTQYELQGDGAVAVIELEPVGDASLPEWDAGAHIDLVLAPGLERQYSLCGRGSSQLRIGVLREPQSRGGSQFVHTRLQVGSEVSIRGPRNNFALVEAPSYVFIAGGIGVTPILPMIRTAVEQGVPWTLTYGGRSTGSMAFVDELAEHGDPVTLWPQDEKGLIPIADIVDSAPPGAAVYVCGPEPLLGAVEKVMETRGADRLHLERFRPRADPLEADKEAFDVVLDYSELEVRVGAEESIVEALERVGVEVMTSCREGTCGTCETVVLGGVPDHRDSYLTPTERSSDEVMMICCSRAKSSRLVLDL